MARRSFRKRVIKKVKRILRMDEAQEIIKKDFTDSRGNKMQMILDVKPQKPNSPTIEWNRQYEKD